MYLFIPSKQSVHVKICLFNTASYLEIVIDAVIPVRLHVHSNKGDPDTIPCWHSYSPHIGCIVWILVRVKWRGNLS